MALLRKWPGDPQEFCYQHHILPEALQQPIRCDYCQGVGEVRSETTLNVALRELGFLELGRS